MAKFLGKGRTPKNPVAFVAEADFYFGGMLIPKGSECKQFETRNFGWTTWVDAEGHHVARE